MKFAKTMARKAKRASDATKSYFGFSVGNNGPYDDGQAHQASADTGQMRAKIQRAFDV
ncbi:hypothetical protein ACNO8X_23970 [Mycobacterium sp. PDNC021]|jgi:hypothetical protein|uniref:hypothetical protein n=1 Tax=Mycobacterium sp. PDNC021 TaxID=3391399 RepID=UPI000A49F581